MIWIYYLLLLLSGLVGLLLVLMMFPGLWLMTAAAVIYALMTHGRIIGLHGITAIFLLALIAEILELILGPGAIDRAGGGWEGKLGAFLGGTIGGLCFTLVPIPVLGTLLGICIGTFIGATCAEVFGGRHPSHALGIGWKATRGKVLALAAKLAIGCVMMLLIVVMCWP